MPKIKLKIKIYNEEEKTEYEVYGIYNAEQNKIIYKEPDNTTTSYDYKNKSLTRDNNELRMEYSFKKKTDNRGQILVKDLNQNIEVNIKRINIEEKDINTKIEYEIENQKFKYIIEVI